MKSNDRDASSTEPFTVSPENHGMFHGDLTKDEQVGCKSLNSSDDKLVAEEYVAKKGLGERFRGFFEWRNLKRVMTISRYGLGIILILLVTVIWVGSSIWIQHIFGDEDFNKPYFLTYFNTTGFCFWNLGYVFSKKWRSISWDDRHKSSSIIVEDLFQEPDDVYAVPIGGADGEPIHVDGVIAADDRDQTVSKSSDNEVRDVTNYPKGGFPAHLRKLSSLNDDFTLHGQEYVFSDPKEVARAESVRHYSLRKIFCCAAVFCPFWFFANYLFNVSLSITTVSSNTILSSTSSVWTLLLCYLFLDQKITIIKLGAVLLCIGGTVMVALSDTSGSGDIKSSKQIIGDIVALVSAFFYALYTSILKWGLPDDERYSMGMIFGAVGILNLIFLWPGMAILHTSGIERFEFPTFQQFWSLAVNALIGTNLSDVLWARSVVLTSPVVATLGLSLTTPLSMIVGAVFQGQKFTWVYIVGAIFVVTGFVLANLTFWE